MASPLPSKPDSFEPYRDYLLILARAQIGPKYRSKIDPEAVVNQALFEAESQKEQFRGDGVPELMVWLKQMLSHNVTDAIKFYHRDKRNIDREQRLVVSDWDQSCSQLLELTCGLTSPSAKAIKHEREWQLAQALTRLPKAQREAIELHHLQGCTLKESAELMESTSPAVVGLLRRGMKHLRQLLKETTSYVD